MPSKSQTYSIAAFDFDNTLISKDTLMHFTSYCFGIKKLLTGMLVLSPILLLNKLGFISSDRAKAKFLSFYFKGMKIGEYLGKCDSYSREIEKHIQKEAIDKLNWHRQMGHKIVIVSASIEDWIKPWAIKNEIDLVISTKIEIRNKEVSGNLSSPNCSGAEKVKRFLEQFPSKDEYQLYVYGDSKGDKELLQIADFPFFKKFN